MCTVITGVDACNLNPCKNLGACVTTGVGYMCQCASGWVGNDCGVGR